MASRQTAWTADRTEFLGRNGSPGAPAALVNAMCGHIAASLDNITPVGTEEKPMSAMSGSSSRREHRGRSDIAAVPAW